MELHGAKRGGKVMPEYSIWIMAKQRCYNPKNKEYRWYGARGIRMCKRWKASFSAFLQDRGERPRPELSLERRDNDRHYMPENCYWATAKEQSQNRRPRQPYIRKDLKGQHFGRLTVLSAVPKGHYGRTEWKCRCTCGATVVVNVTSLRTGNTQSCGCLYRACLQVAPKLRKHVTSRLLSELPPARVLSCSVSDQHRRSPKV